MKVFVTGGTGTVGQYVTKALIDRGDEVVVLTRNPERVQSIGQLPNVTLLKGTLSDYDALTAGVQGVDAVIHMALGFDEEPFQMIQKDTLPLAWLLQEAMKSGVKKFIATSTVATMHKVWDNDAYETDLQSPMGTYGGCKAAAEMIVLGYGWNPVGETAMKRNIIRPTNVYAVPAFPGGATPGDDTYRSFIRKCLDNEDIVIGANPWEHSGEQFISARQLAEVYLHVLDSEENEQVFFGVGDRFITWEEIAQHVKALLPESTSRIIVKCDRVMRKKYNPAKIRIHFGLRYDGIEELDEYLQYEIDRIRRERDGERMDSDLHS